MTDIIPRSGGCDRAEDRERSDPRPITGLDIQRLSGPRHERSGPVGTRSRLRVVVEPPLPACGQAFWDIHGSCFEHHRVPHRPYHSFIEGDSFRIDTDADGRPVFIELYYSRRQSPLPVVGSLPAGFERGRLRFLDLRIRYRGDMLRVSRDNSFVHLVLGSSPAVRVVAGANGLIWEIGRDNSLSGLWLHQIQADHSGGRRDRWRQQAWVRAIRNSSVRAGGAEKLISPISVTDEKQIA